MHPSVRQSLVQIFSDIPFNRTLGLQVDAIEPHHVVVSFIMRQELIGNHLQGILHGGVISSVIDMAGGLVTMVDAIQKHPDKSFDELKMILGKSSTVNLHINYLRPGKGERFTAKAAVLHSGNKLTFAHIELHNQNHILIATGAGTYSVG